MKGRGSYVPPAYIPLEGNPEVEKDDEGELVDFNRVKVDGSENYGSPQRWSSGICACCDDLQSCLLLGLPGCFVASYACGYRRMLRAKYNLQEAPCGDFVTHLFCHLCAMCQEYREIQERSAGSNSPDLNLVEVTPPAPQKMESAASN